MIFFSKEGLKMLVEFSFSNFRSFKEEAVFSMEPDTQNGENCNVINTHLKRVPQLYRTSGIFGANASGKSNIVKAFMFLDYMVRKSCNLSVDDKLPQKFYALAIGYENKPVSFGIKFIVNNKLYEYKFSLLGQIVETESLYFYDISENGTNMPNRVFDRKYEDGKSNFRKSSGILQSWCNEVIDNRLFLSDIVNNRKCNVEDVRKAYDWLAENLTLGDSHKLTEGFSLSQIAEGKGNEIIEIMKKADLGLENIAVRQVPLEEILKQAEDNNEKIPLRIIEILKNKKGVALDTKSLHKTEEGTLKEFDFDEAESDGTKNFLSLVGPIWDVLAKGKVLIVDEMDDSLHPYLVRYLVEMFNNPEINKNKAQLIFTSHAHYLMDGRHLTRDQIWLTTKELNNGYSSSLYSLSDFKDVLKRKNISFQEAYLDGIYGAIPNVEVL